MAIKAKQVRVEIGSIPKKKTPNVIYFSSFEEMNKILTAPRIEIVEAIKKENPKSIYELARILGKDQGNVSKDVRILEEYGFISIEKQKKGERVSSVPTCKIDNIEMVIKLGAGVFGVAKEVLEKVSEEFKGDKLESNKKYAEKKAKKALKPARDVAKKIVDLVDK